jgi:hypothetical protein
VNYIVDGSFTVMDDYRHMGRMTEGCVKRLVG